MNCPCQKGRIGRDFNPEKCQNTSSAMNNHTPVGSFLCFRKEINEQIEENTSSKSV